MIHSRVLPGPMEGVTVGAYCRVMAERRYVHSWITPFIRISTGVPRLSRLRRKLRDHTADGLPVLVQLMGVDASLLAATARRLAEIDHVVGVDLNCGCPSPTVVGNGGGGAMLAHPEWIRDTLCAIRTACPALGIGVKLRSGLHSPDEASRILPLVAEAEPDMVVWHFRTVDEGYSSIPDGWRRFERARTLTPGVRLLASGDLFAEEDCMQLADMGFDGLAPARGLMRDPLLCRRIEARCRGERCTDVVNARQFLYDIARAALAEGRTRKGFLLQHAVALGGDASPLFRAIAASPGLKEATAALCRHLP